MVAGIESAADQIQAIQDDVYDLDAKLADPSMQQHRKMIQQQLFDKIRELHRLKAQSKELNISKLRRKSSNTNPSSGARQQPGATIERAPAVTRSPAPEPQPDAGPLRIETPDKIGLTIYFAEELRIGLGTQQTLEEIARLLRTEEMTEARQQWNSYLVGEADVLLDDPRRVDAISHYIVRQAFIEVNSDLAAFAHEVDSKKSLNADAGVRAQMELEVLLKRQPNVARQIRGALDMLHDVIKKTYLPK